MKCAFGVSAGNFLGFLVHQKGIEINENKAKESNHPGLTPEKQKRRDLESAHKEWNGTLPPLVRDPYHSLKHRPEIERQGQSLDDR